MKEHNDISLDISEEDKKEARRSPTAIEYINSVLLARNYMESNGVIIMQNGMIIRVRKFFKYFKEMWNEYKLVEASGTKKEILDLLRKKTNGGVITNGEIDVFLPDISALVDEGTMKENDKFHNTKPDDNNLFDDDLFDDE